MLIEALYIVSDQLYTAAGAYLLQFTIAVSPSSARSKDLLSELASR